MPAIAPPTTRNTLAHRAWALRPRRADGITHHHIQQDHVTPARLAFIRAAQSAGLTLAEIRSILTVRDHGRPPCTHVTALLHR
jgi:DNA-binding transcriptional MerR regulator